MNEGKYIWPHIYCVYFNKPRLNNSETHYLSRPNTVRTPTDTFGKDDPITVHFLITFLGSGRATPARPCNWALIHNVALQLQRSAYDTTFPHFLQRSNLANWNQPCPMKSFLGAAPEVPNIPFLLLRAVGHAPEPSTARFLLSVITAL